MTDSFDSPPFDSLPPYPFSPGQPPAARTSATPSAGPTAEPEPHPSRRCLVGALGAGAVVLAAGAFLLGRGTARSTSTTSSQAATALSAGGLGARAPGAAAPAGASCGVPRRAAIGTLKSVSGSSLTVAPPKGNPVTVRTDSTTKVTKVVSAALSDVTVGAVVTVRGTPAAAGGAAGAASVAASQVVVLPAGFHLPIPSAAPATPAPAAPGRGPIGFRPGGPGLAVGTVKAVSGATFTVTEGTRVITVTTTSATTFSKTVSATVGDLTVGQPVVVGGVANSDGSITAATIEQGAGAALPGGLPGFRPGFAFPRGGRPQPATPPTTG